MWSSFAKGKCWDPLEVDAMCRPTAMLKQPDSHMGRIEKLPELPRRHTVVFSFTWFPPAGGKFPSR